MAIDSLLSVMTNTGKRFTQCMVTAAGRGVQGDRFDPRGQHRYLLLTVSTVSP